jgi:hypothetical protein
MNHPCFLIEPTGHMKVSLRRYLSEDRVKCPGPMGYHNAQNDIGILPELLDADGHREHISPHRYAEDPRWPTKCAACNYVFGVEDERQVFTESIYRRSDNGMETTLRDAPVGAIWNASWLAGPAMWTGPDKQALMCRLPGGHDWHIDGRCSNCDSPCQHCGKPHYLHNAASRVPGQPNAANCTNYEDAHPHKCWVRTGTPPKLTVGKGRPGESCSAGAGSILVAGWHGYLRNGVLEQC